jgi:hypothetical protein
MTAKVPQAAGLAPGRPDEGVWAYVGADASSARFPRSARLSHSFVPRTGVLFWDIRHPPCGPLPSTPALPRDKLRGFWSTEGGLYARGGQ